ncbi:MAG TPA: ribosomal protein S18-alanine N-acetyltransferase [Burkholderiaceae bacterium]|nr:ribosomal protein S18-alanine N-acetyltransferase [Burkholderiaceae bacterium]
MNAVLQSNRPAASESLIAFQSLNEAWLDRVLAIEQRAYSHPWSRANFVDSLATGYQMQVLCIEPSTGPNTLLGYFVAMKGFEEVHLLNITVAPEYQGRGWGKAMLEALAIWSRGQGAKDLWLEVRVGNARAVQVYQAHGFETVSVRKDYYPAGHTVREDAVVMKLKL